MQVNKLINERVLSAIGFCFLVIATITAFLNDGDPDSILEFIGSSKKIIFVIHLICSCYAFFLIFKPSDIGYVIIMMVESVLTMLTSYEQLGIFFFYASLILIICKDLAGKKMGNIIPALIVIHVLSLIGTFTHGLKVTLLSIASSAYSFIFYLWIYQYLKAKLSCFWPKTVTQNEVLKDVKIGSILKLSDYELNERQITFVLENLYNNLSYKDLSSKYNVSVSTVKRTFTDICKVFKVNNLEELRFLLLQYQIIK